MLRRADAIQDEITRARASAARERAVRERPLAAKRSRFSQQLLTGTGTLLTALNLVDFAATGATNPLPTALGFTLLAAGSSLGLRASLKGQPTAAPRTSERITLPARPLPASTARSAVMSQASAYAKTFAHVLTEAQQDATAAAVADYLRRPLFQVGDAAEVLDRELDRIWLGGDATVSAEDDDELAGATAPLHGVAWDLLTDGREWVIRLVDAAATLDGAKEQTRAAARERQMVANFSDDGPNARAFTTWWTTSGANPDCPADAFALHQAEVERKVRSVFATPSAVGDFDRSPINPHYGLQPPAFETEETRE
jgi:hypothetical protein